MNTMNTQNSQLIEGKIYKITNDSMPNMVYYGSTTRSLAMRLAEHRYDASKATERRPSSSHKLFEIGNPKIEMVEEVKCDSINHLHKRERWFIENNECINNQIPTRTPTEYMRYWRKKNVEHLKEYRKKYNVIRNKRRREQRALKKKLKADTGNLQPSSAHTSQSDQSSYLNIADGEDLNN